MYVLVAGVNHKTAPVEIREKFSISGPALQEAYASLSKCSGVEGTVILHTCNRTEIYATTRNIEAGTKDLENFLRGYSGLGYHELKNICISLIVMMRLVISLRYHPGSILWF